MSVTIPTVDREPGALVDEFRRLSITYLNANSLMDVTTKKTVEDSVTAFEVKLEENKPEESLNDGGVRGWLTVLGVAMVQFTGFGYSNAFGVYQDFYARDYLSTSTSSQISWIGSLQVALLMSLGIITGRLFDKGYFYHIMFLGSFLTTFSIFMLSLAKPEKFYQVFLAQGLCTGLGTGLMFVPSLAVVSQHFHSHHKRTLALGLAASGASLGGILHPIMLNNLFNGSVGFANGVRASGALIGGLLIAAMCLMKTNYAPRKDGAEKTIQLGTAVKTFSKDSAYVFMVIAMFLLPIGFIFPLFYIQLFANKHSVDPSLAFYTLSIMNGASMIGRIVPGFISRKVGVANMLIFTSALLAIFVFGFLGANDTASVTALAALFGFAFGSFLAVQPPMLASLADNPREIGARTGIGYTAQGLGSLVGAPVAGTLLTSQFVWWRPLVFGGVFCACGCVVFVMVRIVLGRRRETKSWIL